MRMSLEMRGQEVEWKERQIITFFSPNTAAIVTYQVFLNMDQWEEQAAGDFESVMTAFMQNCKQQQRFQVKLCVFQCFPPELVVGVWSLTPQHRAGGLLFGGMIAVVPEETTIICYLLLQTGCITAGI